MGNKEATQTFLTIPSTPQVVSLVTLRSWCRHHALSWVTFAFMDKALGAPTTLVRTVAAIERTITPSHVYSNEYFSKYLGTAAEPLPIVEWQFALVVMMVFGAILSSWLSGSQSNENIPRFWKWRFGPTKGLRSTKNNVKDDRTIFTWRFRAKL